MDSAAIAARRGEKQSVVGSASLASAVVHSWTPALLHKEAGLSLVQISLNLHIAIHARDTNEDKQ